MSLQELASSRFGIGLGLAIGQNLPSVLGYPLVSFFAGRLARWNNSPLVQAIRSNQQMIHGKRLGPAELQQAVEEVFNYTGRAFVDLYRNFGSSDRLQRKVVKNEDLERLITLSQNRSFGAFVVLPHMSSFDLMLLAAASLGFKTKVLTFGQPTGGYKLQNEIRAISGLDIMPVSRRANVAALDTLRHGGFVLTGVDRPIAGQKRRYKFFGHLSPLPDGHIRMALKADVPVLVAAVHMNSDGHYQLQLSEPLPMIRQDDPAQEVRQNVEAVLAVLENYIQARPTQWQMFYPVWPYAENSRPM